MKTNNQNQQTRSVCVQGCGKRNYVKEVVSQTPSPFTPADINNHSHGSERNLLLGKGIFLFTWLSEPSDMEKLK